MSISLNFFRNQIRKDINTHTHTHTLGFKKGWHSEETGGAKEEPPTSQALRVFTDHSTDPEAPFPCLNATIKLRNTTHNHLRTLEAHPEKMKCEEECTSSSGTYRHGYASASPKGHLSMYPCIAVRCPDCHRLTWVGIPDPPTIHCLGELWSTT